VPFVSPVIVSLAAAAGAVVLSTGAADPAVNACTWHPVIGVPPADAGAVQLTAAERLPAVAVPRIGPPAPRP
jgi:hypothetical protein